MDIKLRSTAFGDGQRLAEQFTSDGANISPALSWDEVPPETVELALICDDPDAPGAEPWVHWLLYRIPAATRVLAENLSATPHPRTPVGALQGRNSWDTIGYRGPSPPPGKAHRYRFRIIALDAQLDLDPGIDRAQLEAAMHGHVLAQGLLTAYYGRKQ